MKKKMLLDQLKYVVFIDLSCFKVSTLLILEEHESLNKFKGALSQHLTSFLLSLFSPLKETLIKNFFSLLKWNNTKEVKKNRKRKEKKIEIK